MTAKVKDLESGLLPKKNLKKSALVDEKQAAKITKQVHASDQKEKIIKTSIDLPETFYKQLKIKLVENGETMKAYLMRLVREDLNK